VERWWGGKEFEGPTRDFLGTIKAPGRGGGWDIPDQPPPPQSKEGGGGTPFIALLPNLGVGEFWNLKNPRRQCKKYLDWFILVKTPSNSPRRSHPNLVLESLLWVGEVVCVGRGVWDPLSEGDG